MPIEPESSEMLQDTCDSPDSPAPKVRRKRHWMISLIRIVLISYVVVLVMLVMTETQMLYPGAYMKLDGNSFQPASTCRPWEYPAEDGTMIVGRLRDRPGSSRTVLFFHGNGVKAIQLDHWIERLSQHLNANVMAAEYRGFQQSQVTPHESNLIADALSAHDALCKHYQLDASDLIVYGRSLGGGCAAAVAAERNTKTLILDRTFDSVADVAAEKYPIFPIQLLIRNRFDSIDRLSQFRGHLIQIHGTPDQIVPIAHGKRLHESVPTQSKVFLEIPDMGHNDQLPGKILDDVNRYLSHST